MKRHYFKRIYRRVHLWIEGLLEGTAGGFVGCLSAEKGHQMEANVNQCKHRAPEVTQVHLVLPFLAHGNKTELAHR